MRSRTWGRLPVSADPRSRLSEQARLVVEEQYKVGAVPRHVLTPEQARSAWELLPTAVGPPVADVSDVTLEGRGGPLSVRIYRPGGDSVGTLLYMHGGGWVTGTVDGSDAVCRRLALLARCNVVSLGYRLAPEFPFPAAVEDAWDCLVSIAKGNLFSSSATEPIAVGGMSAGGNLAAVMSLMAREAGFPKVSYQLLVVPVLDCDLDRTSYFENEVGLGLEREEMKWFWDHYLAAPEKRRDWRASPIRAEGLAGLPRTSIVVADCDPLRDEDIDFAERLHEAGVPVVCTRWYRANHGFFGNDRIDAGAMALRAEAEALRRAFASSPEATKVP